MKYSEVIFTITKGEDWQKDLLMQELAGLGFDSFEDHDQGFSGFIPTAQFDPHAVYQLLIHQDPGFEVDFEHKEIEVQNWNAVWESNFHPIVIGNQVYVRATFHPSRSEFPYEIIIDPKMAFGTGHHQTTSMMIRLLLAIDVQGKQVLDMGCGTGILAMMASKLGAEFIVAIDNDPICQENTMENALKNGVENIQALCGSQELIGERRFDLILANITRNIILDHLPAYVSSLEAGGNLLLSGFYDGADADLVVEKAGSLGLKLVGKLTDQSWCAIHFVN